MVVGSTSEILVEDGRPGIKEVCHVSEFRSFECNRNTYGLCLVLVLSRKPHRGTNIWRFLARLDPAGRGATKGRLRHGLVCKKTWSWIVGKVHNLSRVLQSGRSAEFKKKNTLSIWRMEPLKDLPLYFPYLKFYKPQGVSNIAIGWDFGNLVRNIQVLGWLGTWWVISTCSIRPYTTYQSLQSREISSSFLLTLRKLALCKWTPKPTLSLACRDRLTLSLV